MAYIITETCVDLKDRSCVDVCPVDCIIDGGAEDRMLVINPDECIDCGACVDPCPVAAIYPEDEVPAEMKRFIPKNAILRDPSIDFASDFSVATNRLEPMARFQSQLLTERLDLKILQGLTTKRYRGVVSYQLSDSLSTRFQLDNEHIGTTANGTDFGIDLHLKWEGD